MGNLRHKIPQSQSDPPIFYLFQIQKFPVHSLTPNSCDLIEYSSDIGLRKEFPDFYKRALEIVGRSAEDCIMVGDNYDVDVLVPQQLGIRAVWIKNPITYERYPMAEEYQNRINLDDIENLPNLVEKLLQKPL